MLWCWRPRGKVAFPPICSSVASWVFSKKKPSFPKRPHQRNGLCTEMEPENGACPSTASSSIAFINVMSIFANLYTSSTFPLWFHISGFEVPHTCQESQNCKAASDQQLEGRVEAKGLWSLSLRFFNQLHSYFVFFWKKKGAFQSVNPRNLQRLTLMNLKNLMMKMLLALIHYLNWVLGPRTAVLWHLSQPVETSFFPGWMLNRRHGPISTRTRVRKGLQSDLLKVAMSLKKAFESTAESKQTPSVPQESALRSKATLSKKYELPLHVTCQNVSTYNLTTIQWCSIYWEMNCLGCLIVI